MKTVISILAIGTLAVCLGFGQASMEKSMGSTTAVPAASPTPSQGAQTPAQGSQTPAINPWQGLPSQASGYGTTSQGMGTGSGMGCCGGGMGGMSGMSGMMGGMMGMGGMGSMGGMGTTSGMGMGGMPMSVPASAQGTAMYMTSQGKTIQDILLLLTLQDILESLMTMADIQEKALASGAAASQKDLAAQIPKLKERIAALIADTKSEIAGQAGTP